MEASDSAHQCCRCPRFCVAFRSVRLRLFVLLLIIILQACMTMKILCLGWSYAAAFWCELAVGKFIWDTPRICVGLQLATNVRRWSSSSAWSSCCVKFICDRHAASCRSPTSPQRKSPLITSYHFKSSSNNIRSELRVLLGLAYAICLCSFSIGGSSDNFTWKSRQVFHATTRHGTCVVT